jgi:hypothetical protein
VMIVVAILIIAYILSALANYSRRNIVHSSLFELLICFPQQLSSQKD